MLVHSGDRYGGHYFALIKPDRETRWLKFDDDKVTPVTDREVLEENYGGEPLNGITPPLQRNQVRAMKRFTNAYMLVYIRESATEEILSTWKDEDTPAHLSESPFNLTTRVADCHQSVDLRMRDYRSKLRSGNARSSIFSSRRRFVVVLCHLPVVLLTSA